MLDSCILLAQLQADLLTLTARSVGIAWMLLVSAAAWPPGAAAPQDRDLMMLGLERMPSSGDELRRAYRRAAKAAHPDAGGSADAFRAVSEAFRRLAERTVRVA
jgi:hypothetical protein